MDTPLKPNAICPWPGLASYEDPARAETRRAFCGRDKDSEQLSYLIDKELYVTLYGKSGIGKTSLINAGVFPRLREMGYLPLSLRLGRLEEGRSYSSFLLASLEKELQDTGCRTETIDVVAASEDETATDYLWNYFARHRFFSAEGEPRFPVFVFDQFEEVFAERPKEAATLLRQINYITDDAHEILEAHVGGEDYAYDFNFRFVLSIREDDLYKLESCLDAHYLQRLKSNRYRLFPMSETDARDAILIPAGALIPEAEKDGIVQSILEIARDKESGTISTNILSLVCSRIFAQMQKTGQTVISQSLVGAFMAGNPFENFYKEVTAGMSEREKSYMEEHLVDASGRRNSIPAVNFFKKVPDGERLLSGTSRILQRVSVSSEASRIELIHDSFCQPLMVQREKRLRRHRRRTAMLIAAIVAVSAVIIGWIWNQNAQLRDLDWKNKANQARYIADNSYSIATMGLSMDAIRLALEVIPKDLAHPDRPMVPRLESVLRNAAYSNEMVALHNPELTFARLSDDASLLLTGGVDSLIHLWRTSNGKCVSSLRHGGKIKFASFNQEGNELVSASSDGQITVWKERNGEWKQSNSWRQVADFVGFDAEGRVVTYFTNDSIIRLVDKTSSSVVDRIRWIPVSSYSHLDPRESSMDMSRDRKWIHATDTYVKNVAQTWLTARLLGSSQTATTSHGLSYGQVPVPVSAVCIWSLSLEDKSLRRILTDFDYIPYAEAGDKLLLNGKVYDLKNPVVKERDLSEWDVRHTEIVHNALSPVSSSIEHSYVSSLLFSIPSSTAGEAPVLFQRSSYYSSTMYRNTNAVELIVQSEQDRIQPDFLSYSSLLLHDEAYLYRAHQEGEEIVTEKMAINGDDAPFAPERVHVPGIQLLQGSVYPFVFAMDKETGMPVIYDLENQVIQRDYVESATDWQDRNVLLALLKEAEEGGRTMAPYDIYINPFAPHGTRFFISSQRDPVYALSTVSVWDAKTRARLFKKDIPVRGWSQVGLSSEGKALYVMGDRSLLVYDVDSGALRFRIPDNISECCISDAANKMLTINDHGQLSVRDAGTGSKLDFPETQMLGTVLQISVSPDGLLAAFTLSMDRVVVFNLENGERIFDYLQTGSFRMLHTQSMGALGSMLFGSQYETSDIASTVLLAGGKIIFSDEYGTMHLLDVPPLQELIDQSRRRFQDNPLTPEERYKYYLD